MTTEDALSDERIVAERLFQILIVDGGGTPDALGPRLDRNISALRAEHPDAKHSLLSGDDLRCFISAHFSARVLAAYDVLAPYAYKSDLGRACLLYAFGGLYVDIGVRFVSPFRFPRTAGLAGFRDQVICEKHVCSLMNAVLYSRPQRPEMLRLIDAIVEHAETRFYGPTPLDPTGPPLLGRVVAAANDMDAYYFGDFVAATPGRATRNTLFIDPAARLVAIGKTAEGGDLGDLQTTGTNNYNDFWRARRAYGEFEATWTFNQPEIHVGIATRTAEGIEFRRGSRGCATFGPYATLFPGSYRATLLFRVGSRLDGVAVDVTARCGDTILVATTPAEEITADPQTLSLPLKLDRLMKEVEIRIHVNGDAEGHLLSIRIENAKAA